jgi:DNA processing protein
LIKEKALDTALLNPSLLALAFAALPWPEARKAAIWAAREEGREFRLPPGMARDLARLEAELPKWRVQAAQREAKLCLPGDPGMDALMTPLPYPVALWVRGSLPSQPAVAIVGARKATPRGLEIARTFGRELTRAGLAVLSGLARGIDGAAHEGALEAGPTWGVLGSGLDHPYPAEHAPLMARMAERGGVITCFPPWAHPKPKHFPRRNVLLAAWSEGVLVVEAQIRSGSFVTAKLALDHGKELFAVPGSEGTDALLEEGAAHPCESPQRLVEILAAGWPLGSGEAQR